MKLKLALAPLAIAIVLAGCGYPATTAARYANNSALAVRSRDAGTDLIAGLRTMAAGLNTFSATVGFWESSNGQTQTSTAQVFTARPGKIRANITDSSQPLKKGAKIVYLDDQKVTVKLGFLRRTLPYDDPQVVAMHGWRIDQTDLGALINGLTDPAGQATALGAVVVNGVAGQAVSVTSPTLLAGTSKEVVTLDPTTFVPLRLEAYIGNDVVYRLDISNAQQNPVLPADIFVI